MCGVLPLKKAFIFFFAGKIRKGEDWEMSIENEGASESEKRKKNDKIVNRMGSGERKCICGKCRIN